jgi:hypothetical protein
LCDDRFFLPFGRRLPDATLALRCIQADWINIMATERVFLYKRLIQLPAGRADAPKLQGSGGRPTAGKQLEKCV